MVRADFGPCLIACSHTDSIFVQHAKWRRLSGIRRDLATSAVQSIESGEAVRELNVRVDL